MKNHNHMLARKVRRSRFVGVAIVMVATLMTSGSALAEELIFNTQDFAPFSFEAEESVGGPASAIIRAVCEAEKLDCAFKLLPWKRAQAEVRDGQANGMFVIGRNAEREEWLHFSPAIITTEYGFFVQEGNPIDFKTIEDVRGYTVGVYGPSNTSRSLESIRDQLGDLTIEMKGDDESGFRKLSLGRVDAVFSNRDVGNDMVARLGLENIRYAGAQRSLNYYIGFSKAFNDADVVARFNARLAVLIEEGVVGEILSEHNMVLR